MSTKNYLKSAAEALLFLQHKPLSLGKIRTSIDDTVDMAEYKEAVEELISSYQTRDHGIELAKVAGGLMFRTKLEHKDLIRRLEQVAPARMSQAVLEVLSIAAFHQPLTREKIESIRGVECGNHLRNLMEKKLIKLSGRSDTPGRPMLYSTTKEFLELFGLTSLSDVPSLGEIEELLPKNEVGSPEELDSGTQLRQVIQEAERLEFSDIEQKEAVLFPHEQDKENSKTASQKDGTEEKATNGHNSPTQECAQAQNSEAQGTAHQQDQVAGTVAFGSVQPEQEEEWTDQTQDYPEEDTELSKRSQPTTTEDPVRLGSLQSTESGGVDSPGTSGSERESEPEAGIES